MMKFKDEQGNFVTPRKGDYVLASDIKDEDMHNRIREAFVDLGCVSESFYGEWSERGKSKKLVWYDESNDNVLLWGRSSGTRRIIPHQQTLFEAVCEAEDGARFKINPHGNEVILVEKRNNAVMVCDDQCTNRYVSNISYLSLTDFEQLPSGPKKRTLHVDDWVLDSHYEIYVPFELKHDAAKAFKLMSDLLQWEGAQIGKPGYTINPERKEAYHLETVILPHEVTFKTIEQCEDAWKAECPEMFSKDNVPENGCA